MSIQEAPTVPVKPASIRVLWMKAQHEEIDFDTPMRVGVSGVIQSGKSVWLECFGENGLSRGHNILDLFGSPVSENLGWLRSPWIINHKLSVLLIKGNAEVTFNGPRWPCKHYKDLRLEDIENTRLVLSVASFYNTRREEVNADKEIMQLFERRIGFNRLVFVLVREASYLVYSRSKVIEGVEGSKMEGLDLIRQSGHWGLSLGLDSQRPIAVDKEIRDLFSQRVFRSMGQMAEELPDWIYGYVRPEWVQKMKLGQFLILSNSGNIGIGRTSYPLWHKGRKENLLRVFGIDVKYHNVPKRERRKKGKDDSGEDPGDNFRIISDK